MDDLTPLPAPVADPSFRVDWWLENDDYAVLVTDQLTGARGSSVREVFSEALAEARSMVIAAVTSGWEVVTREEHGDG